MSRPTPPREFVSALRAFDPLLRLRWGHRQSLWIIERKMPPQHKQFLAERPNPWKSSRGLDLYDGWKDGYLHVLSIHPSLLDHRVFATLKEADIWAKGGIDKMNRALDEVQVQQRAEADKTVRDFSESASRDAHDQLQWGLGNRFAMTRPEPAYVDTGQGFKVRDRRHGTS